MHYFPKNELAEAKIALEIVDVLDDNAHCAKDQYQRAVCVGEMGLLPSCCLSRKNNNVKLLLIHYRQQ